MRTIAAPICSFGERCSCHENCQNSVCLPFDRACVWPWGSVDCCATRSTARAYPSREQWHSFCLTECRTSPDSSGCFNYACLWDVLYRPAQDAHLFCCIDAYCSASGRNWHEQSLYHVALLVLYGFYVISAGERANYTTPIALADALVAAPGYLLPGELEPGAEFSSGESAPYISWKLAGLWCLRWDTAGQSAWLDTR